MKRRSFLQKSAATAATMITAPYILPTGRLFAATGSRKANHVVFVLFAGGIRQQESVEQQYLAGQGFTTEGNIMENMLVGAPPSTNFVYNQWTPIQSQPLMKQGTLFSEVRYAQGPTGHYNGHTVAMTGKYTETGLNLNVNPDHPTIFEYYRKHSDPAKSAMNSWWLSEGLGPYPSLNYSRHPLYGSQYGANYLRPLSILGQTGQSQLSNALAYQPDDVQRILNVKRILDNSFANTAEDLPGIQNTPEDRERIKNFTLKSIEDLQNGAFDFATPGNNINLLTGDLVNISMAWRVLDEFAPELMVINTTNLDICHDNFSAYIDFLHRADYGVGWLWDRIQSHPVLKDDTIMICMPEHGRNQNPNTLTDANGLLAYDHTSDANSRRLFALIVGPQGTVVQDQVLGSPGNPAAESIDIVPTIAHILGVDTAIPGFLPGRVLSEAFV